MDGHGFANPARTGQRALSGEIGRILPAKGSTSRKLGLGLALTLAQGCTTQASRTQAGLDGGLLDSVAVTQAEAGSCPAVVATGNAPLIDDFASSSGLIASDEGRSGKWFFYDDGTPGKQAHSVSAADGNTAFHVSSTGYASWGSGFAVAFSWMSARECPYDARAYGGLQFRARGKGRIRLFLGTTETTLVAFGGTCTSPGNDCSDRPGIGINLQPDWQQYTLPFCRFRQEGWSSLKAELDPSQLTEVGFNLSSQSVVDFWLDDLKFTMREPASNAGDDMCRRPCPFEAVPAAIVAPDQTSLPQTAGLELHTFAQESVRCGPLTRRYLSFVPASLPKSTSAPVLIVMHGSLMNAELMWEMTRHRLDALAQRDGVVVVYGNGAPGEQYSSSSVNSAVWRQSEIFDDGEVDDVRYLELVLADLAQRGVISGGNPVYLTGMSNGGGMVLAAARKLPMRLSGIAAFMPFDGLVPPAIPDLTSAKLARVLFGISSNDPQYTPMRSYLPILDSLPSKWAMAMGIPPAVISAAVALPLPDLVVEGKDYTGTNEIALRTRNSHVNQIDYRHAATNAQVRTLVFENAGHLWPTPTGDTDPWLLNQWGFRNQDVDASDVLWEFFGLSHAP